MCKRRTSSVPWGVSNRGNSHFSVPGNRLACSSFDLLSAQRAVASGSSNLSLLVPCHEAGPF